MVEGVTGHIERSWSFKRIVIISIGRSATLVRFAKGIELHLDFSVARSIIRNRHRMGVRENQRVELVGREAYALLEVRLRLEQQLVALKRVGRLRVVTGPGLTALMRNPRSLNNR